MGRQSLKPKLGRLVIAALVVLILGSALFLASAARWQPLALVGARLDDGYARAAGVVHVHTTLSDGGAPPEAVIAAAQRAGLDFVGITDHNGLEAFGYRGYHDRTLVLAGVEISTRAGHLLALGLDDYPSYLFTRDARDGLADVHDLGGFAFAAHPLSPRESLRWNGWDLDGPWNMEIINGDSEWRRADPPRLALTLARYAVNPSYALLRMVQPPGETLARWDELLAERDVVGLYGADAHSRLPITSTRWLHFPSYDDLFALARNHVLLTRPLSGDTVADRAAILDALRAGRFYIGLDALAPAGEFSFVVSAPGGERWTMGDEVVYQAGLRARAGGRVPAGARLRLLRDGAVVAESLEEPVDIELPGPGVYRVEVTVDGWQAPWVLSNAIAVFGQERLAARQVAWPAESPPVEPAAMIDDFDGETAFEFARDEGSLLQPGVIDPHGGYEGGAARVSFFLGHPTADDEDVFVALIDRQERDLSGRTGLSFRVRADGVYRMWVQVRDDNPASTDGGTEWWSASVKTGTEWRLVNVPFSELRSDNPRSDGQLDLDAVRALVFVIDKGAMKPGSRGTIRIDRLGLY